MHKLLITALISCFVIPAIGGLADAQTTTPEVAPTSSPSPHKYTQYYLAGDYVFNPAVTNQFNPHGNNGRPSFAGRAGIDYAINNTYAVLLEGDYQSYNYDAAGGVVPVIGGNGTTNVASFGAHNTYWDVHLGYGLSAARVFIAASFLQQRNNYGYPNIQGYGYGVEKVADFDSNRIFSPYGSFYYYPHLAAVSTLRYSMYTYQAGIEFHPRHEKRIPLFLDIGYLGNHADQKLNAPAPFSTQGVYTGVGLHF